MAATYDFSSNAELRTLVQLEVEAQQWRDHKFSRWMGPNYLKYTKGIDVGSHGMEGTSTTGAPIETQKAFITEGRTEMLIPVMNRFTDAPFFGGTPIEGMGEKRKLGFRSVQVNQTRKPFSIPTGMEKQKVKQWKKLINDVRTGGAQWMSDWMATQIQLAMHAGYSSDLTFPVAGGGMGVSYISHPNFFVPNSSRVATQVGIDSTTLTYTVGSRPGTSGYEAAVEGAIDGLNSSTTYGLSAEFLADLVQQAAILKINPISIEGARPFYPVWVNAGAWRQLERDPDFKGLAKALFIDKMADHPLGNGMISFYEGAALFTDLMMFTAYTNAATTALAYPVTAGQVWYGPPPSAVQGAAGWKLDPTAGRIDVGSKAVGFLVGKSALTVGTGENVHIEEQFRDFGETHEVAFAMIQSVVRGETYATIGDLTDNISGAALSKGDFYENTTSLSFCTNSPFRRS